MRSLETKFDLTLDVFGFYARLAPIIGEYL